MSLLRFWTASVLTTSVLGGLLAIGCAPDQSEEDLASSEAEISGSLAHARACAVTSAYTEAEVADFTPIKEDQLPFSLPPSAAGTKLYFRFEARGFGTSYYVESTSFSDGGPSTRRGAFYDVLGRLVATADFGPIGHATAWTSFYAPGEGYLVCNGGGSTSGWSSTSSSGFSSSGGWWTDAGFGHD